MSQDMFVPKSAPEDARVGPLHTVTYVTADREKVERLLTEGMGLTATDWFVPDAQTRAALAGYLGIPGDVDWQACAFNRTDAGRNVQVRVIHVPADMPQVRPTVDGRWLGGLSIGFPMADIEAREAVMAGIGVKSSVGLKEMAFPNPMGGEYISGEIHFMCPENIFMLGVRRPSVFVPVGPMDSSSGKGAAAYSARCVTETDRLMGFFRDVLGYEIRRDTVLTVSGRSGLRLNEGQSERFIQAFAPGAATGYLVFLDHADATMHSPAPGYGPPGRGVAMWSFRSARLDVVYAAAVEHGVQVIHPPGAVHSPFLRNSRALLMRDPGGFLIEVFED